MGWQDAGVAVIVAAAVLFLLRRVLPSRRRRSTPAETFVPLTEVKKRSDRCH